MNKNRFNVVDAFLILLALFLLFLFLYIVVFQGSIFDIFPKKETVTYTVLTEEISPSNLSANDILSGEKAFSSNKSMGKIASVKIVNIDGRYFYEVVIRSDALFQRNVHKIQGETIEKGKRMSLSFEPSNKEFFVCVIDVYENN